MAATHKHDCTVTKVPTLYMAVELSSGTWKTCLHGRPGAEAPAQNRRSAEHLQPALGNQGRQEAVRSP